MKIKKIDAYQVFDSRGNPTVEVEVTLADGVKGCAIVASGASTGRYEALELRDGVVGRFNGKSVERAIGNVCGRIAAEVVGWDVEDQEGVDGAMIRLDGSADKSELGANAIVGVSMAVARAAANYRQMPLFESLGEGRGTLLPLPEIQIIGGGAHTGGRIDVQDFMIICTGAKSYGECLEMTYNVYHHCGRILGKAGKLAGVADEGGYWPEFDSNEEAIDVIVRAIEMAGYEPGVDVHLSLDIAASEFFRDGRYHLTLEDTLLDPDSYYDLIAGWCRKYPVISIEDPFSEEDTENWRKFTAEFGGGMQVIGDDLFTTNLARVEDGGRRKLANSVLIKLNQVGTVTETLACIRKTVELGWTPVVSARSGETEDAFISHLAVATNAGQLKVGSFTRSERMVKWNEVIRIARELGGRARFVGGGVFGWVEG